MHSLERLCKEADCPRDAEVFLRQRMSGGYEDLPQSIHELADDYNNLLRSISTLIVLGYLDEDEVAHALKRPPITTNGKKNGAH